MPRTHRRPDTQRKPLPNGYHQSLVTSITIFIGFSLALLRFWAFEAPGDWTVRSVLATVVLALPIVVETYALFRALRVANDDEVEYAITVRWFLASVIATFVAVVFAAVVLSAA